LAIAGIVAIIRFPCKDAAKTGQVHYNRKNKDASGICVDSGHPQCFNRGIRHEGSQGSAEHDEAAAEWDRLELVAGAALLPERVQ
jgi:hypothetical protein